MKDTARILRLSTGEASREGRLFRKEIARVGSWTHPATGETVVFSRADLEGIAARTNRYIHAIGGRLRVPNKHDGVWINGKQPNADDNLAWALSLWTEGDRLFATIEPGDAKVADAFEGRIRYVSLCLVHEEKDSHGGVHKDVLEHIAATPQPVIDQQEGFIALAKGGERAPIYDFTEVTMSLKNVALALSLAADADEAAVLKAVADLKATPKPDAQALSRAATAEAQVTSLSAKVATLEADKTAREKAEIDGVIVDVTALATKAGKPDAFTADDQKLVRELWSTNRGAAQRIVALAKDAIGAPGATTTVVKPSDKVAAEQQAAGQLEGKVALARASGAKIEKDASGTYAVRGDGVKVKLG